MSVEFLESKLRARFGLGEGEAHHAHFAHIFGWLLVVLSSQLYNHHVRRLLHGKASDL